MAYEFRFPDVGEGITEGELVKWLVKEGDFVKEHQPIAKVETDKAVVEIPSPVAGTVLKLGAAEGSTIKVGQVIITLGLKDEKIVQEPIPPKMSPTSWRTPSRQDSKASSTVVGELEEAPDEEPVQKKSVIIKKPIEITVKAVPAVRKLAKDLNVDLTTVEGTGQGGRVTEEDVRKAAEGKEKGETTATIAPKVFEGPKVTFEEYGRVLRVPFKGLRKKIAENMVRSATVIPHVTHMDEIDVTELVKVREKEKQAATNKGIKLTYLPFITKAVINALKEYPYFNTSLDEEKQEIVIKQYYHMGYAVQTGDGLMVVVIKNADQKSILELAKDMEKLSEQARTREIKIEDLKGSTFTITNVGSIGGLHATPIINHPEAAILATGRIYSKPIAMNGKIVVRKILPISLSFDHRIVDGAQAAEFANTIKTHLEDPDLLLVDVT